MTIKLTSTLMTTTPDFTDGFRFYVESGRVFDADDFADAYSLNRSEIDHADVHAAQDRAAQLEIGEWLEISYEMEQ